MLLFRNVVGTVSSEILDVHVDRNSWKVILSEYREPPIRYVTITSINAVNSITEAIRAVPVPNTGSLYGRITFF